MPVNAKLHAKEFEYILTHSGWKQLAIADARAQTQSDDVVLRLVGTSRLLMWPETKAEGKKLAQALSGVVERLPWSIKAALSK